MRMRPPQSPAERQARAFLIPMERSRQIQAVWCAEISRIRRMTARHFITRPGTRTKAQERERLAL